MGFNGKNVNAECIFSTCHNSWWLWNIIGSTGVKNDFVLTSPIVDYSITFKITKLVKLTFIKTKFIYINDRSIERNSKIYCKFISESAWWKTPLNRVPEACPFAGCERVTTKNKEDASIKTKQFCRAVGVWICFFCTCEGIYSHGISKRTDEPLDNTCPTRSLTLLLHILLKTLFHHSHNTNHKTHVFFQIWRYNSDPL